MSLTIFAKKFHHRCLTVSSIYTSGTFPKYCNFETQDILKSTYLFNDDFERDLYHELTLINLKFSFFYKSGHFYIDLLIGQEFQGRRGDSNYFSLEDYAIFYHFQSIRFYMSGVIYFFSHYYYTLWEFQIELVRLLLSKWSLFQFVFWKTYDPNILLS